MRRVYYFPYVSLLIALLILGALSPSCTHSLRYKAVGLIPSFHKVGSPTLERPCAARIVFRDPAFWNYSLWVDSRHLQGIAKNDPVLFQGCLIGIVEELGEKRARVRLITDPALNISVRAVRGDVYNFELMRHVEALEFALYTQEALFSKKRNEMLHLLENLTEELMRDEGNLYLAKGVIHGLGAPMWRSSYNVLKGVGFNCDYPDAEGPARDIRTGMPFGSSSRDARVALIRVGDLLVTTGLDGLFPPDLPVATVVKVEPLAEGETTYNIEATAAAGSLDDMYWVEILQSR